MTDHIEPVPDLVELDEQTVAVIAGRVPMGELPEFFDRSFTDLAGTLAAQDVAIIGPAFARYQRRRLASREEQSPDPEFLVVTPGVTPVWYS